ncbi:MAG: threonine-phosphate decarboxylase [Thaumarchaeota archaeon]|nr:threonine-phosphate decarboxylase [Nitrososphaerota archaeon]
MRLRISGPVANHRAVVHGGIQSSGRKTGPATIDFSSNVNPLGCPPAARNILKKSTGLISQYPDSNSALLRKSLAKYTGVQVGRITVGNGATEIIYNFCRAFLEGRKVLMPVPTFGEYEAASRLYGARMSYFKTMDLNKDIDGFLDEMQKNQCVFVCNPNNPTGALTRKKNLGRILDVARRNSALVFIDECFIELASNPGESVVPALGSYDNLFVLRSMTKSFGLAGLRVGYGLGSEKMITVLNTIKIPWNLGGVAQNVATKTLPGRSYLGRTRSLIEREREFLKNSISKIRGFQCYDSDANFMLVRSKVRSGLVQRRLLERGILVRDCSSFRGLDDSFIRIAVRTRRENRRLVEALGKI